MKYSEIQDCPKGCPVFEAGICPGGYACYGGNPIEPPCTSFEPDTDLEEWIVQHYERELRRDEAEDRRIRKEAEQREANALAQKRRNQAKWEVLSETKEIKRLKKAIMANNAAIRSAENMAFAINTTNEMFGYSERKSVAREKVDAENEKMLERIKEVEQVKKDKLAALRKRRAMERSEPNG